MLHSIIKDLPEHPSLNKQIQYGHLKELICHLKGYLQQGRKIGCRLRGCDKTFSVKSTFASHISRAYRKSSFEQMHEAVLIM